MAREAFEFGKDFIAVAFIDESVTFVDGIDKNLAPVEFSLLKSGVPVQARMKVEPTGLPDGFTIDALTKMIVWLKSDHATPAELEFNVKLGRTGVIAQHVVVTGNTLFLPGFDAVAESNFTQNIFHGFFPEDFGHEFFVDVNDILQTRLSVPDPGVSATVQVDGFVMLVPGITAAQVQVQRASVVGGEK